MMMYQPWIYQANRNQKSQKSQHYINLLFNHIQPNPSFIKMEQSIALS